MKAKVTSAAIVASVAIIIGSALVPVVATLVDNAFSNYGGRLQWDALFTGAVGNVVVSASLIAGVAAVGAWFHIVHIRVALIAAGIASIERVINIVVSDDKVEFAMHFLALAVSIAIVGALLAVIIVVAATSITRARGVVGESYRDAQEHHKKDPDGPDLK